MTHSASSRSRYIWDEWGDEDEATDSLPPSFSSLDRGLMTAPPAAVPSVGVLDRKSKETLWSLPCEDDGERSMSSIGLNSAMPPSSALSQASAGDISISVLKSKIQALRKTVEDKTSSIRNLQQEFVGLQSVKEQRRRRFEAQQQRILDDLRSEQAAQMRKLQDFQAKLLGDVQKLRGQQAELARRHEAVSEDRGQQLERARSALTKRASQSRRQWEAEDQAAFVKALAAREEALKKGAADSLSPKLESLVRDLKATAEARRQEETARLSKLRVELQEKSNRDVDGLRRSLLDEIQHDITRAQAAAERRIADLKSSHTAELQRIRDSHAEALVEARRQLSVGSGQDAEAQRQNLQAAQRAHHQATQTLLADQQQQLSLRLLAHAQEVAAAKAEAQQALRGREASLVALTARRQEDDYRRCLQNLQSRLLREREMVLRKLREDHATNKEAKRSALFGETDELRARLEGDVAKLRDAEERSITRITALRTEIAGFEAQLQAKKTQCAALEEVTSAALVPQLRQLQEELQTCEVGHALADHAAAERDEHQRLQAQEREVRAQLHRLRQEHTALAERLADRKAGLDGDFHGEVARIEAKIAAVLRKKDDQLAALRTEGARLGEENVQLQRQLEELRDRAFA